MNSTLNFGIPPILVFQLEVYYKVDRLLIGLTAQQKGTTARWYSNKTSLVGIKRNVDDVLKFFFMKPLSPRVFIEGFHYKKLSKIQNSGKF